MVLPRAMTSALYWEVLIQAKVFVVHFGGHFAGEEHGVVFGVVEENVGIVDTALKGLNIHNHGFYGFMFFVLDKGMASRDEESAHTILYEWLEPVLVFHVCAGI